MGERERERDTSVKHDILMFGQVEGRKKLKGEVLHLFLIFFSSFDTGNCSAAVTRWLVV